MNFGLETQAVLSWVILQSTPYWLGALHQLHQLHCISCLAVAIAWKIRKSFIHKPGAQRFPV